MVVVAVVGSMVIEVVQGFCNDRVRVGSSGDKSDGLTEGKEEMVWMEVVGRLN